MKCNVANGSNKISTCNAAARTCICANGKLALGNRGSSFARCANACNDGSLN